MKALAVRYSFHYRLHWIDVFDDSRDKWLFSWFDPKAYSIWR